MGAGAELRKIKCRCGTEFQTNSIVKSYCTPDCQKKFAHDDSWERVKQDYKYRCARLMHSAKYRAKQINVYFDLSKEHLVKLWEDQDGRCAVSGRVFDLSRPAPDECVRANSPSLDRIDSKGGYVEGNVRLVCYQVNTALNQYGEEALINLCRDIIQFKTGAVA